MESSIVGILTLVCLRGVAWMFFLLPPSFRHAAGNGLGFFLRRLRLRSDVVEQNLKMAFPSDAPRRAQLYRDAYSHLGHLALEILMLLGPMRRFVGSYSDLQGEEHWREAKKKGKGVIFLANHVGNWEIMAATGAVQQGIDVMLVTKHLKPEWLHQAIERGRAHCGVRATYEPRTLKDVLSWLKKGNTVGFVLDQYAGPPIGVRVPVFGVPVGTTTVIAALAKRTGAVVLPVGNYRKPNGRWVVEIRAPLSWKSQSQEQEPSSDPTSAFELAQNTSNYASEMERDIYAHPDQWLWIHRRFKGDLTPIRPGEWSEGRVRS